MVESHPQRARARVDLTLEICSRNLFARGQDEILNDEVRSYALGTPAASPFCVFEPFMELDIKELMQPTVRASADLRHS